MPQCCAVPMCSNKTGGHRFPKDKIRLKQWIAAIRRDRFTPSNYSIVCKDHFSKDDYEMPKDSMLDEPRPMLRKNAVPSIFPWNEATDDALKKASKRKRKRFKKTLIPSDFPCTSKKEAVASKEKNSLPSFNSNQLSKTYSRPALPVAFAKKISNKESINNGDIKSDPLRTMKNAEPSARDAKEMICFVNPEMVLEVSKTDDCHSTKIKQEHPEIVHEISKSDECHGIQIKIEALGTSDKYVQTDIYTKSPFSIHNLMYNDKAIHFYTGLENFTRLSLVFESLGESAYSLNYFYSRPPSSLTPLDQFFITLIVLRRHLTFNEISMMYMIPLRQVHNIFITWIRFMALQWRRIDLRESDHTCDFGDKKPITRVIIFDIEFPIKKPQLPSTRQTTFSSYKNRNTVKALIGVTPGGLINYVSSCYGGSVTDRQLIEESSVLKSFTIKDEAVVDEDLSMQDLFTRYGIKLNTPFRLKKLPECVHVDRMLRTYKILKEPMNKTETVLASDIVFICAMLLNFKKDNINNFIFPAAHGE